MSDKLFQTVGAVKLRAFLDISSSPTMLGMHKRLAPDEQRECLVLYFVNISLR